MAESDNILTKLQDLLLYLIPQLNNFPRDQKFVLGDRIETKLLAVKEDCLRAYYSHSKQLVSMAKADLPFCEPLTAHSPKGNAASVIQGWRTYITLLDT